MNKTVILIGPSCTGKSTIGKLLAEKLACPNISLDDERWAYYKEIGYDSQKAKQIWNEEGRANLFRYWKPFEAHAVGRVLEDRSRCVIDFGAGHSVYEDETLFNKVAQALAPYPHVILLLPSPDLDKSVKIVNERLTKLIRSEGVEPDPQTLAMNEHFVRHPSNGRLAKHTIYTENKTPDQACSEILKYLSSK